MTPTQRVIAQLRHEETDYLPYVLDYEGDVLERVSHHFGGPEWLGRVETFFRARARRG